MRVIFKWWWPVWCLALILAVPAGAVEPQAQVNIGKLHYGGGGDWYSNPSSLPNLLQALRERLGLDTPLDPIVVKPMDDTLYTLPLVYFTGHGNIRFTPQERERLRWYVDQGGFLWADDNYGMDPGFRREVKELFPEDELVEIPYGHPIYHTVYDLPKGPPKIHEHDGKPPQGLGVFRKERLVLLYTYESDIGDGMEDLSVHNVPPEQHETALRFGVNVMVYALSF